MAVNKNIFKLERYFEVYFPRLFQMGGPPQPGYPQAPGVSMPSGPGAQQPTYQVKQDRQRKGLKIFLTAKKLQHFHGFIFYFQILI